MQAAIWLSDLRGFTALSDRLEPEIVVDILNRYFDCQVPAIRRHGGEILKFMGDGLLAIFPLGDEDACGRVLATVVEIQNAIARLNDRHRTNGRERLGYGIGVHLGDVMYGNIGSENRLDFTVIGEAVNIASRLESLTKEVGQPVLFSQAFADMAGDEARLESLGSHHVKGLATPIAVFGLPDAQASETANRGWPILEADTREVICA